MPGGIKLALGCALLVVAACSGGTPSAAQLEWCALNQAEVGRSAVQLGLFDDQISFDEWKESRPTEYDEACVHAFERVGG